MSDAPSRQRLVDLLEEFRRTLGIGREFPPDYPPDQFIPLSSLGPDFLVMGREIMIPLRFIPSVSVDRVTAKGILDNLVSLGFIADEHRLRRALDCFFAIKDRQFLVPTPNDVEGWKEVQRRDVQPLQYRALVLAARLAEVADVVEGSIPSTPVVAPSNPQAAGGAAGEGEKPASNVPNVEAAAVIPAPLSSNDQSTHDAIRAYSREKIREDEACQRNREATQARQRADERLKEAWAFLKKTIEVWVRSCSDCCAARFCRSDVPVGRRGAATEARVQRGSCLRKKPEAIRGGTGRAEIQPVQQRYWSLLRRLRPAQVRDSGGV